VNPWFYGVSFNRYYHGVAPWITVPMISDRRIHRYDLLREKMSAENPLADLTSMLANTLRGGGRVYLVGCANWLGQEEHARKVQPLQQSPYGWSYVPYTVSWSEQLAEFLLNHVRTGATVPQFGDRITPNEDVQLCQSEGWHD
jgi:hypothetical protein